MAKDAAFKVEGKRPVRRTDMIASIVLVLVAVLADAIVTSTAALLAMMSDGCDSSCNFTAIEGGYFFALAVPTVVTLVGIFITILRVVKRRIAFWVPLATIGAQVLAIVIGAAIMVLGLPGGALF